jgi:hypothetical protein
MAVSGYRRDLISTATGRMGSTWVMSSQRFNSKGSAKLHEICRVIGLPGKPEGSTAQILNNVIGRGG